MSSDTFERELRAALSALSPNEVPATLHAHGAGLETSSRPGVARLLEALRPHPGEWFGRLGSVAMGVVAIVIVLAMGSIVVLYAGRAPADQAPGGGGERALRWQTRSASLEANAIRIEAGGRTFGASAERFSVVSDEGTPTYRTLEIGWREEGVEMRLYLYFAADETHWWVSEVRTYDGAVQPDWIIYRGPLFKTERGASFDGSVDLSGGEGRGPGRLRIENMRLSAFAPGTGPRPFEGCRFAGPAADRDEAPVAVPLNPLAELGLARGTQARETHQLLTQHGLCHEFRLTWLYQGHSDQGYGQRWCTAPPGVVDWWTYGDQGQLIVFVEDPVLRTFDPNTPQSVGCD